MILYESMSSSLHKYLSPYFTQCGELNGELLAEEADDM